MSAAVSVHLESASPLIDVPTVRDPEIRPVDGSVHHTFFLINGPKFIKIFGMPRTYSRHIN